MTPYLMSTLASYVLTMLPTVKLTAAVTASLSVRPDSNAPTKAELNTSPVPW